LEAFLRRGVRIIATRRIGNTDKDGNLIPVLVKPGDHVVFAKYGTNEIDVDGEKLLLMRAEDIYAKYAD
jgi:chaperonin GroES